MKYRITEHSDGNGYKYYIVEFLQKNFLWGESWRAIGTYKHPKIHVPTKFESLVNAQRYIKAQARSQQVVEEGII